MGETLRLAVADVRGRVNGKATVVGADEVPWDRIRIAEGGWDGAYRWAVRMYDGLVVVPVGGAGSSLSRGVFTMAQGGLMLGKGVYVWRRGEGLTPLGGLALSPAENWKSDYGRVT